MFDVTRRTFLRETACSLAGFSAGAASGSVAAQTCPFSALPDTLAYGPFARSAARRDELIARWDAVTAAVTARDYGLYYRDGDVRGLKALQALDYAFDRVVRQVKATEVAGDVPAVWSVYNMGYVVKTRRSVFTIDFKHRRAASFAPSSDFALVTHNHGDHFDRAYCQAMDKAGKPVVSGFLQNAAFGHLKAAAAASGTPDEFRIRDVEVRTFRVDHATAAWGIDFTTAFEIRIGDFRLLHTGDCGVANGKLHTAWGRPDLWLLFPMSSLDVAGAVRAVAPKRCALGHLWELGHDVGKGRAVAWHIKRGLRLAAPRCKDTVPAFWGDRII